MVTFNFDKKLPSEQQCCVVTLPHSGADDYLATLRSLIRIVAVQMPDLYSHDDTYNVLTLVEHMLPEPEQLKC